jgi:HEAT repeat protein
LKVYGREKAAAENKEYSSGQAEDDFTELENKDLLNEGGIGRNPYWLKMIVEEGLYTPNRGLLLHRFAEKLISREIDEKPEERKRVLDWKALVPVPVEMDALASLALAMHLEKRVGFKDEPGWKRGFAAIRDCIEDTPNSPNDILREAEAATLLRMQSRTSIDFIHQLVQEFFAAYALRHEAKWGDALSHCDDHWWWQTLFILGGLIGEKSPEAHGRFVRLVLGDGSNQQRLFAAIGLLRSVADPPSDLSNRVVESFGRSMKSRLGFYRWSNLNLTESQHRAINELKMALGEGAVSAFAKLLENPDRDIQIIGIWILSIIGGRRAAELIISDAQASIYYHVGSAALVSIGPSAVEPLIAALQNDDQRLRYTAIEALGEIGDPRAVAPLMLALKDETTDLDNRAEQALVAIGEPAVKPLLAALRDEDANMSERVTEALRKIASPGTVDPVIAALRDGDFKVRGRAARVLGKIGDPRAVEPLIDAFRTHRGVAHEEASRALAMIGTPAAQALVLLLGDEDASIASDAEKLLVAIGAPAVEPLVAGLQFTAQQHKYYGDVRERAADALAEIGDPRAVEALGVALQDKGHRFVRISAAYALGKIGNARAVEPLITALGDNENAVSAFAADALVALGEPAVEPLMTVFKSETPGEAASLLIRIGAPAVDSLISALSDNEAAVRRRAADALGQNDPRVIEPLIKALKDTDQGVGRAAINALRYIGNRRALEELERVAQDDKRVDPIFGTLAERARDAIENIKRRLLS